MAMEEDDTPNIEKGDKAVNNTIRSEDTELQNTRTKSKAMDSSKITTEDIYLEHHKNHTQVRFNSIKKSNKIIKAIQG